MCNTELVGNRGTELVADRFIGNCNTELRVLITVDGMNGAGCCSFVTVPGALKLILGNVCVFILSLGGLPV